MIGRALFVGVVMLWGAMASAQPSPADAAVAARERLQAAADRLAQVSDARDRVSALTDTVRAYEDGLVALRDGMRRVRTREQTLTRALDAKSDEVAQLLAVLQTMGQAPAPLLLLHPSGALGTARSGMILSEVTPALQSEAELLRTELEELALLRGLQEGAAQTLQEGLDGAHAARVALASAIDERTDLPRRFADDPVQTALLLASSDTLDGFASALAQIGPGNGDLPGAAGLRGTLSPPVNGPVLRDFNETDAAGHARPGVVVATRPRALVTVPAPATLRFKGPLLDYGTVAILEPAADVLIVLAGMAEVFGTPGEVLPTGSPLGLMGGLPAGADGILTESSGVSRSETLYIEVREYGEPVDPRGWFVLE